MQGKHKALLFILVLIILLVIMQGTTMAKWSGSQTITWEWSDHWLLIYTSVLDYGITDNWHITLVVDKHPIHGTDLDMSITAYVPLQGILYTTVGVRRRLFDSDRPTMPYVSVTVSF